MSREAVEAVIGKAVVDSEFRKALFADPDQALEGYELAEEEVAGLKAIDSETLESMAGTLDERISKTSGLAFLADSFAEGLGKPDEVVTKIAAQRGKHIAV